MKEYSVPQNSFPLPTGSIFSFATLGFRFRKRLRRGNRYFILRNALGIALGVAGTPENLMVNHPFEKVHPSAARPACGPQQGDDTLMARYDSAAAHEA